MIMLFHRILLVIGVGVACPIFGRTLGYSISILLNTYAHFIPTMQNQAAQLMDNILTPIPIVLGFGEPRRFTEIYSFAWQVLIHGVNTFIAISIILNIYL
jgi:hypothetical protein